MNERLPTRREVLTGIALGTGGVASGAWIAGCTDSTSRRTATGPQADRATTTTAATRAGLPPHSERILVVIELLGGVDGLSVLVPHENGRYHDLRPTIAIPEEDLLDIGGSSALHGSLANLHERGLAIVTGVGSMHPSLSHFDMRDRWYGGTPNGAKISDTGFLGRICDRLAGDEIVTGMTIDQLPSTALNSAKLCVDARRELDLLPTPSSSNGHIAEIYRDALVQMGTSTDVLPLHGAYAAGLGRVVQIDSYLRGLPELPSARTADPSTMWSPAHAFAQQLSFAIDMLTADLGLRVLHIPVQHADFDTHGDHLNRFNKLMPLVAQGIEQFLDDLEAAGLADRVLIATTSEFGRRPAENSGAGLDHGTSSTVLALGPVNAGVHGEEASLKHLDISENMRATTSFDRYLATLATWLGVDPAEVLIDAPRPIASLLV